MGFTDSLKRKAVGLIDTERRQVRKEEKHREADNRKIDRWEKENALEQGNMNERIARRKMFEDKERPFSVKEYAKSRGREASNNAKISFMNTFNRENLKEKAVSGGKSLGSGIKKGGIIAGERLGEASVQSYGGSKKRSNKHNSYHSSSLAEELGLVARSEPQRKKGKKARRESENSSGLFGGSDAGSIFTQDFSGIYGHASKGSNKRKKTKSDNPFGIDTSAFGY